MPDGLTKLEQTFWNLIIRGNVYPREQQVAAYIKKRLRAAGFTPQVRRGRNITARWPGPDPLEFIAHMDVARRPPRTRRIYFDGDVIHTDGTGILGADDLAAVAVQLELADAIHSGRIKPVRGLGLTDTTGEEGGMIGATLLHPQLVPGEVIVHDWLGSTGNLVTKGAGYAKIDLWYTGRAAHPAQHHLGINAGAALAELIVKIKQGNYTPVPGVTCNVGYFRSGEPGVRNVVPEDGEALIEMRSHDLGKLERAQKMLAELLKAIAKAQGVEATVTVHPIVPPFVLDTSSSLYRSILQGLQAIDVEPEHVPTEAAFDASVPASWGKPAAVLGASFKDRTRRTNRPTACSWPRCSSSGGTCLLRPRQRNGALSIVLLTGSGSVRRPDPCGLELSRSLCM